MKIEITKEIKDKLKQNASKAFPNQKVQAKSLVVLILMTLTQEAWYQNRK